MLFAKALVLLTAAMSASAISTQHMARNVYHRRHAVTARSAVPETVAVTPTVVPKKRVVKRCKAKNPTSSSLVSSSTAIPSSSAVASTSAEVQTTSAPVNVGGDVPTFSSSTAPSTSAVSSSVAAPVSSSAAPSTPTSSKAAPTTSATPTTTKAATTTTTSSSAAAATSTSDSGDLLTATHSGDGTWYETGLGACGITNNDSQHIAAVSHLLFDTFPGYTGGNPNNNPICGKTATATWEGKSVTVTLTDRCVGCDMFSLDFSPSAFTELADQSVGRLTGMTWKFD